MLKEKEIYTADRFHITENVNNLTKALKEIHGVEDVEYDLDGFYDNLNQVIFLTKYELKEKGMEWFSARRRMIHSVVEAAKEHGLTLEEPIEDQGTWLYFVMNCDERWIKNA